MTTNVGITGTQRFRHHFTCVFLPLPHTVITAENTGLMSKNTLSANGLAEQINPSCANLLSCCLCSWYWYMLELLNDNRYLRWAQTCCNSISPALMLSGFFFLSTTQVFVIDLTPDHRIETDCELWGEKILFFFGGGGGHLQSGSEIGGYWKLTWNNRGRGKRMGVLMSCGGREGDCRKEVSSLKGNTVHP